MTGSRVAAALRRRLVSLWHGSPFCAPRRFHAYCIGAAKTGTHSVHGIFSSHYRSAHEPERVAMVAMFQRDEAGRVDRDERVAFLRARDRLLWLEMDSSALNRRYAGLTAELFPESKYILTIRDPFTRTDSLINHLLQKPLTGPARARADVTFHADRYRHAPQERILAERGLHTLDGYLSEYAETTADVLAAVPRERLLVVRTDRLRSSLAEMADFLGIPAASLDSERSHRFKAGRKHGLLAAMDPAFVDEKVHAHCSDLMAEFFPEIRSVGDVRERLEASP